MTTRVLVLGAGFGGLELTTILSETAGSEVQVTLIDKSDAFVFGFNKFDIMFGWRTRDEVSSYYRDILKPGVTFRQESITAIDPVARQVTTDRGTYEADILVVGLGAEYDLAGTPGLVEGGNEFYSVDGAAVLRETLPSFAGGNVVVGVLGEPFKCPPAPCEAAMLMHEYLSERGIRDKGTIKVVSPWGRPIPPSPDGSRAILERFAEFGIEFVKETRITHLDPEKKVAHLMDGGALEYDLFLGVPRHRVPAVVVESGMAEGGWIPVDRNTLATKFPNVFAVGDVTSVGTPKAGVFSENAARVVAAEIIAGLRGGQMPDRYLGTGTCYVEFGGAEVARLDANFFEGPSPVAPLTGPNAQTHEEKRRFAVDRRRRWFGYSS